MKRHAWPTRIVEIPRDPRARPDPRSDPQATRKITREQLDDALRKTKSGTRPVVRSEPDLSALGPPRDTGPEIKIVRIDSVELSVFDPAGFPPASPAEAPFAAPSGSYPIGLSVITPLPASTPPIAAAAVTRPAFRLQLTPRLVLLVGLALATLVMLAVLLGFVAGRIGH